MGRRLLNAAGATSAVLCVLVCGLWVRSLWAYDRLAESSDGTVTVGTYGGALEVWTPWRGQRRWRRFGFASTKAFENIADVPVCRVLTIPLWPTALLTAAAGGPWAVRLFRDAFSRRRRRSRLRRRLCPACGYDLRATPQAGGAVLPRCPECGAVPSAAAARNGAA